MLTGIACEISGDRETYHHSLTTTQRGELHYMRVRHADDEPPEGFM